MYRLYLIVLLAFTPEVSLAQIDEIFYRLQHKILLGRMSGIVPPTLSIPGTEITSQKIGSTLLNPHYYETVFLLKDLTTTEAFHAQYDLSENVFYLKVDGKRRMLRGERVKSFYWYDLEGKIHTFMNCKETGAVETDGFYEILSDGRLPLLKKTSVSTQNPNYVIAMDIGSKDYKIWTKEELYFVNDSTVQELPKRKALEAFFTASSPRTSEFISINNLDLSDESHIIETFWFYNSSTEDQ